MNNWDIRKIWSTSFFIHRLTELHYWRKDMFLQDKIYGPYWNFLLKYFAHHLRLNLFMVDWGQMQHKLFRLYTKQSGGMSAALSLIYWAVPCLVLATSWQGLVAFGSDLTAGLLWNTTMHVMHFLHDKENKFSFCCCSAVQWCSIVPQCP